MRKSLSNQNAAEKAPSPVPSEDDPKPPMEQATEGSAKTEGPVKTGGTSVVNDVHGLDENGQKLVYKMLSEGWTFEDVVETFEKREGVGITLTAIQNYFQAHRDIQAKRARYLVKSGEALLATLGKDPRSAEARLARAAFLTGYLKLRREGSVITPKEAEQVRVVRENLSLKRRLLTVQKQKALQALKFSEAKTRFIVLAQEKLKEEISKLQQEAKKRHPGEPMGPEMLQQIQQLYGLACQPLLCEANPNAD